MLVVADVSKLPAIYMSDFSFFALIQGYIFVENVSVNLLSVITQIFQLHVGVKNWSVSVSVAETEVFDLQAP